MKHHPHRPDRIALGLAFIKFILIFTAAIFAAVAVALIQTGRLT